MDFARGQGPRAPGRSLVFSPVDPSRAGGAFSGRRHAFSGSRVLSQAGEADSQAIPEVRDLVRRAIEVLKAEIDSVSVELDLVSGPTLRIEPEGYRAIPIVGQEFTPLEVRTQILSDARAVADLASRIRTGALSGYISQGQSSELQSVKAASDRILSGARELDLEPIREAHAELSDLHTASHVAQAGALVEEAERAVVSAEASDVAVVEPAEKRSSLGVLLGLGILAAVVYLISENA